MLLATRSTIGPAEASVGGGDWWPSWDNLRPNRLGFVSAAIQRNQAQCLRGRTQKQDVGEAGRETRPTAAALWSFLEKFQRFRDVGEVI